MQLPRTTSRGLAIGTCNETFDWLIGEGLFGTTLVDEMVVTNRVELIPRLSAAHIVQKLAIHIDT